MSIPLRHHFVSQCLIQKFFNSDGYIFQYDKFSKKFLKTQSSKEMFFEKTLNSQINDEGEIDHSKTEEILNRYFESEFPTHYNRIMDLVIALGDVKQAVIEMTEELEESLKYVIQLGIIGVMRTPHHKLKTEETIFNPIKKIITELGADKLKESYNNFMKSHEKVKYKIAVDFKELCDKIISWMGDIVFSIYIAPKENYFILPDCTSVNEREQLMDDNPVIEGVEFHNPNRMIALVGMPISSNVFVIVESKKISRLKFNYIQNITNQEVYNLNRWLFDFAHQRIACENSDFLKEFVQNHQGPAK